MGELRTLMEKLRREQPPAFDNADYEVRLSYTNSQTDMRIMSFVDLLWNFEVTGGVDQFEPLTIISVCMRKDANNLQKEGKAIEAGMRVNDVILQINDTPADDLTLMEACELIRQSHQHLRIYVRGDGYSDPADLNYEVTLWYRIPPRNPNWKWEGSFPWNDKGTKILRESNCFQVPSKVMDRFKGKFEPPSTDRFFPKTHVDSIWNRKWHVKESECIEESFETKTLPMPRKRPADAAA